MPYPRRAGDDPEDNVADGVGVDCVAGAPVSVPRTAVAEAVDGFGEAAPEPSEGAWPVAAMEQVEDDRAGYFFGFGLLVLEPLRPRHERPPEQDVDADDHDRHGEYGEADLAQIALVDGRTGVGADAGEGVGLVEDADRFRGDEEEPAAAHAHHPVPDQSDRAVGDVEAPEPRPAGQPQQPGRFVELAGLA